MQFSLPLAKVFPHQNFPLYGELYMQENELSLELILKPTNIVMLMYTHS